jgi:cytochrome c551/c552
MRRYSALMLLAILVLCASNVTADDEMPVFNTLRCGICHKAETGKTFPSLREITTAYKGDSEKLEKYLQGKADPIVNQEKSKTMERYIEKTKSLSEGERQALVEFILSHKE